MTESAEPSRDSVLVELFGSSALRTPSERKFIATINSSLQDVESVLLEQLKFTGHVADAAGRYLLLAGGKRVRPALTLLTAQLGEGANEAVISAAAAIEITHLGSLYHDDVMDDSQLRRGVPSAQSVWGNSVAILTGDLLFARASKIMASLGERALENQADTFERLVRGQLNETVGPGADEDPVQHYISVLADKTGSLLASAAHAGVVFGEAPDEYLSPIVSYGEKIGVAFQLADDVIDLAPRSAKTGKVPGTDLRAGVTTLPLLRLRELAASDHTAEDLNVRISAWLASENRGLDYDEVGDRLVSELRAHEATKITLSEAHKWANEAVAALESIPPGVVRKALTRLATSMVERNR